MSADAFVILTTPFWRPEHRCDRSEIDQLDRLESVLYEYLPAR